MGGLRAFHDFWIGGTVRLYSSPVSLFFYVNLHSRLLRARDLTGKDKSGLSDPYAIVDLSIPRVLLDNLFFMVLSCFLSVDNYGHILLCSDWDKSWPICYNMIS